QRYWLDTPPSRDGGRAGNDEDSSFWRAIETDDLDELKLKLHLNEVEMNILAEVRKLHGQWNEHLGWMRSNAEIDRIGPKDSALNVPSLGRSTESLRDIILEEICVNMGYDKIDELGVGKNLVDAGMTSMTAVRIKKGIAERAGIDFDANAIFDNPTAEGLVAALIEYSSAAKI
ncbi:acyl carrier protein, partial [Nocardia salmonicida]|uniref:acyl carrier protein n=1 Tax=Nocardia salmonicida TaxID=53431 RepID=UPI000AA66982